MVVYFNQLFFIKATKAAVQSRLSKCDAVDRASDFPRSRKSLGIRGIADLKWNP